MPRKIFWPDNLRRDCGFIRGQIFQNIVCVVDNLTDERIDGCISISLSATHKGLTSLGMAIVLNNNVPQSVFQDGEEISAWIIYYSPPIPGSLQFYSIKPLLLDLHSQETVKSPTMAKTIPKLSSMSSIPTPDCVDLEECLNFINAANPIANKTIRFRRLLSEFSLKFIYPLFYMAFHLISFTLKVVLKVIEWSHLAKISKVGYQLQLRIQQLLFWPPQYFKRQETEIKLSPIAQAQYIGFFNTVWLIANDIIIGFALKNIVIENSNQILSLLQRFFDTYAVNFVTKTQLWLLSWPGGLKLNSELGTFLANLFEWMILAWSSTVQEILLYWPYFLYFIGLFGGLGATFVISAFEDIVQLLTIHLKLMHLISARIYNWSLFTLSSTFNLFQGKKWNPLRQRVDSAQYELDQFLMGTIIFTLFMFLLPTISSFYAFYGLVTS